jgi:hypothetical protein
MLELNSKLNNRVIITFKSVELNRYLFKNTIEIETIQYKLTANIIADVFFARESFVVILLIY